MRFSSSKRGKTRRRKAKLQRAKVTTAEREVMKEVLGAFAIISMNLLKAPALSCAGGYDIGSDACEFPEKLTQLRSINLLLGFCYL